MLATLQKAVFLDRDGTINVDVPYCAYPKDLELLPQAAEAIRMLNQHQFLTVVVSNQSGIGRKLFTEEMLQKVHEKLEKELAQSSAHLDAIYYCTHHPDEHCKCRKPQPTLLFQAAEKLNIDLSQSYMVGDKITDTMAGQNAGCVSILIQDPSISLNYTFPPDHISSNLFEAALWLIQHNLNNSHIS